MFLSSDLETYVKIINNWINDLKFYNFILLKNGGRFFYVEIKV